MSSKRRISVKVDPLNIIRQLVSKQKRRFKKDGFNLDLSYVGRDIVAMGFPCDNYEQIYRNPMHEVQKFFEKNHKGKYKIYNLCAERWYDEKKMNGPVCHKYRFFDHEAPEFDILLPFCKDVKEWLDGGEDYVSVIHCKAGKGRTGVMISCYLLYSQKCSTVSEALAYYGHHRTKDQKGVTIPSQKRYVSYFHRYITNDFKYPHPNQGSLILKRIVLSSLLKKTTPNFYIENCRRKVIYNHRKSSKEKLPHSTSKKEHKYIINCDVEVSNDVRFIMERKESKIKTASLGNNKYKHMYKFWFNTKFIDNGYFVIKKPVIDDIYKSKSKRYPKDFQVELYFVHAKTKKRADLLDYKYSD